MNKKNNNKGFTLAELLIVVAIIAVLVAIAIPVFSTQLEKSREATDLANARSAYAQVVTDYLQDDKAHEASFTVKQTKEGWQHVTAVIGTDISVKGGSGNASGTPSNGGQIKIGNVKQGGTITIKIDNEGKITVDPAAN